MHEPSLPFEAPSHLTRKGQLFELFPIVFAGELPECSCCDEPFCEKHGEHYADCACVGPDSEGYEHIMIEGFDFAMKPVNPDEDDLTLRA